MAYRGIIFYMPAWKRNFLVTVLAIALSLNVPLALRAEAGNSNVSPCSINISRDLKLGSTGADVLSLQKILNQDRSTRVATTGVGSPGHETLLFGFATQHAVRAFQAKYSISRTGTVGPLTRAKIKSICTSGVQPQNQTTVAPLACTLTKNLTQGVTDPEVKLIQKILNSATSTRIALVGDGSPGHETNYFGLATFGSVIKFKRQYAPTPGSIITGKIDASTRTQLVAACLDYNNALRFQPLTTNGDSPAQQNTGGGGGTYNGGNYGGGGGGGGGGGTPSTAHTYYVAPTGSDSNDGTGNPWLTLQKAANTVVAGDTVIIRSGNYAGFVMGWDTPQSGTESQPITFRADPGATITSRNVHTADGIDLEGTSYITIDGFTITNGGGTITRAGIRVSSLSGTGNIVRNNYIDGMGRWGIFTSFSENVLIENNTTINSIAEHGIYVSNSADNPIIRNNLTYGNSKAGIQINSDITQGGDGIVSNALIERNIIYNNGIPGGGSAINLDGTHEAVVQNNLLYNNHSSGIALFKGDAATGAKNNVIVNNTLVMAVDARWAININSGSTGNKLYNNILFNNSATKGSITIDASSLTGFVSNNNVLVNRFSADGGDDIISLADWQGTVGQDSRSFISTSTATFVSATTNDYHLDQNSTAIDAGTAIKAPANDLEDNPRPTGSGYEIGAYEYSGTYTPTVPATPSSLSASTINASQISVSWSDNSNNETNFLLDRQINGGTWTQIATPATNATSYTDSGLSIGVAYNYRIRATNSVGTSVYSNSFSVTIPAAPAAPTSFEATATSSTRVSLSWTDASTNETGFSVERKIGVGSYSVIATTDANVTTYLDKNLTPSTLYTYRIQATNTTGQSSYTTEQATTTFAIESGSHTIWADSEIPINVINDNDANAISVGVKFRSLVDGYVTGVRFYKGGTDNGGTHVGNLWSSTGTLLASTTFTGETSSGWQEMDFDTPVAVTADTTYVISYFAPQGNYSYDSAYFTSSRTTSGPLIALQEGTDGSNAVYNYCSNACFPTESVNSTNYWADVVFSDTLPPLTITASAGSGGTISPTGSTVVANGASQTFTITPDSGNSVATLLIDGVSVSTTTSYTFSNVTTNHTIAVTFGNNTLYSLWTNATTPGTVDANDGSSLTLGVRFSSTDAGYVKGVRFYKSAANTGTHIGSLWNISGTELASTTFSGESASGWQESLFSSSVPITANTQYFITYFAPQGHYSFDGGYFTTLYTNAPLSSPQSIGGAINGVFCSGVARCFANTGSGSPNYWVDVIFGYLP